MNTRAAQPTPRSSLFRPAPERPGSASPPRPLRIRWLGRVRYRDALALQHALFARGVDDHLLLLEHPHVFTLGARGDTAHILVDPVSLGAEVVAVDRGGDVTYHGPGQLVGYPVRTLPGKRGGGMADTQAYVASVEQLLIDALARLGLPGCGRLDEHPGVWVEPDGANPRKIAAIGVRLTRARTMHGFALNVDTDMTYFDAIVPCGIADKAVTSLAAEGVDVAMADVVDVVAALAAERWAAGGHERQDVAWRVAPEDLAPFTRGLGPGPEVRGAAAPQTPRSDVPVRLQGRLREAGVHGGLGITERKPEWMRVKAERGDAYRRLKSLTRQLDLVTVCEEAGCPNIYECWNEGTATFMILGERCTRACGFCLIDTRKPEPPDPDEPDRVADAVARLGLEYVVVTMVARDDLDDGGALQVARTVEAIRAATAGTSVEVLISDLRGDPDALETVFASLPTVLNHNIETVPRLQRAVRPSASYARSLAVLARAKAAGLATKTSIIVGMGETPDEVVATLADLANVGVDIVTIGQYLRPTSHHVPIHRWWTPEEFADLKAVGEAFGIAHVESSPLTRSSYHAAGAMAATDAAAGPGGAAAGR